MTEYLHGLHDPGGEDTMRDKPGSIVHTVALSKEGPHDYTNWKRQGFRNIVRLNHGYFPDGTIPHSNQYGEFARVCAEFCVHSPGIDWVIIGNEPNHIQERPNREEITPEQYAKCFDLCYAAIRNANPNIKIMLAAMAPWDNSSGDWLDYTRRVLAAIVKCDGFALHAYTHGPDPALITSMQMVNGWLWNFRVYQETLALITDLQKFPLSLPVFITETDQADDPWADVNSGWVQNAFVEINSYNSYPAHRPIDALCLYRWTTQKGDRWHINDKPGVIEDFKAAVAMGFKIGSTMPAPIPPTPTPEPTPPKPTPPPNLSGNPYLQYWDPRLTVRKAKLTVAATAEGQAGWHVTYGKWYDKGEAQGRVNIFISVLDENGKLVEGVPVKYFWGSGSDSSKKTEIKHDPWLGEPYSLDYPMKETAPSYGIQILDGVSDIVDGLGLGSIEEPDFNIHTAYWFKFQKLAGTSPNPDPKPEPPNQVHDVVHPLPGAVVSQHFYQNPANYERFAMPGHNGTDLAGKPVGTPILAIADGVVAYTDVDADYGNYVRVAHPQLGIYSFYAHCQQVVVKVGQAVRAGNQIALLGFTGNVDPKGPQGAHLHLEIRGMQQGGAYVDISPMPSGRMDPETWCALHGLKL